MNKWTELSTWNYGFKFIAEGESEHTVTGTKHDTADWDATGTFHIAGDGIGSNCDINFKGLKIYESGVLVKDFKPASDENDVAGLYEEVEGEWFFPTGGSWTAYVIDTDEDGYSDAEEKAAGSDSEDPNSTPDDIDGDGWSNADESMYSTDPTDPNDSPDTHDSDNDGFTDKEEGDYGTDPDDPDDNPGIDSDGDGFSNGDEQDAGTDPDDPDSHP